MTAQLELLSPPIVKSRVPESAPQKKAGFVPLHSSTRIPELDGLRGIAILLVLYYHQVAIPLSALPISSSLPKPLLSLGLLGWSGVDLFFVLSGFLIGGILLDARSSPNYFKTFYIRRAYRILPLYAALLVLLLAGGLLSTRTVHTLHPLFAGPIPWLSYATFTQNIWMAAEGSFGALFLAVTWSLAIEEQFYLTLPFAIKFVKEKRFIGLLIGVIIAAPFVRMALYRLHTSNGLAPYVLMPCRADALVLGVLAAYSLRQRRVWDFLCSHAHLVRWAVGFLSVIVLFFAFKGYSFISKQMISAGYTCMALLYASLLVLAVTQKGKLLSRFLQARPLIQIGQLAYGIYLIHEIISWFCHVYFAFGPPRSLQAELFAELLTLPLVYCIARLSWQFFEKPMLSLGYRYKY
jgi:peptidoglycan/LPS O-acetylase OafA/YrhL